MIPSFIKTMFRHLWAHRLFTVLNVLGLAVGISAGWVIYRIVDYEFSFDKKVQERDRVFQVVSRHLLQGREEGRASVAKGLLPTVSNDISGVELVVPAYYHSYETVTVPFAGQGGVRTFNQPNELASTLPDYFEMLSYRWLAGNAATALNAHNKVVLTHSRAEQYFPGIPASELLGKTILYDDTLSVQVSGVVTDLNFPNSFHAQEFVAIPAGDWINQDWDRFSKDNLLYVRLQSGVKPEQVLQQINALNEQRNEEVFAKFKLKFWYELLPLADKHFAAEYGDHTRTTNKKVMYGLIGVAAFLILLACINYINLSTAQMARRAREIGIRKTLGSTRAHLIARFLGETLSVTLAAVALSFLLSALAMQAFSDFIPGGMTEFNDYFGMAAFLILLVLAVTFFSGVYPAWLITRVQTANVLKGQEEKAVGNVRFGMRRGLIIFQFVVAQVFIVSAIITGQQLRYTLHKDLGFNREAVLTVEIPAKILREKTNWGKQFVLKQELQRNPGIAEVALGDKPLDDQPMMSFLLSFQSDTGRIQQQVFVKSADSDLMQMYDIRLLAGRGPRYSDTIREYTINEAAMRSLGIRSPELAIGRELMTNGSLGAPIVGVVKDFHTSSFKEDIAPAAFTANRRRLSTVNIKLPPSQPGQWKNTIDDIAVSWKKLYPGVSFEYEFYDETIAALYTRERNISRLISVATGLAIFISCLGLFGLATLTAFQRTKEIGIRKVLGASISGIVGMLSTGFVKLVLIAILIASPIAWWAMNKWLQNFAYRIEIQWWMFILAGLLAVVIALLTVSLQSVKAALVNPVKSLRNE